MRRAMAAVVLSLAVTGVASAAPEARDSTPTQLLNRYAPVLVLHPDERFVPVPVDGFLADSDLLVPAPDGTWQASTALLPQAGPASRLDQRSCRAIERTGRARLLRSVRAGTCRSAHGVRGGVPHP